MTEGADSGVADWSTQVCKVRWCARFHAQDGSHYDGAHVVRKRPIEVAAMELHEDNVAAVADWCGGRVEKEPNQDPDNPADPFIVIPTLEGDHRAQMGDWIIRGVKGEFYPCKPDIFDQTYEVMSNPTKRAPSALVVLTDRAQDLASKLEAIIEKDAKKWSLADIVSACLYLSGTVYNSSPKQTRDVKAIKSLITRALGDHLRLANEIGADGYGGV